MRFREIEKILKQDGWFRDRVVGSHYQYKHPNKKGVVTVPYHKGDLDSQTVKSIFRQAGL